MMRELYHCHKKIQSGEDEMESLARIATIRTELAESVEGRKDLKEKTLRIQGILNSKPTKATKVAFMLTSAKAHLSRKLSEQNEQVGGAVKNNVDQQVTNV